MLQISIATNWTWIVDVGLLQGTNLAKLLYRKRESGVRDAVTAGVENGIWILLLEMIASAIIAGRR
jgi:hypothetical protein